MPGGGETGGGYVPVCLADGTTLNVIEGDYVPVIMADGQTNQIKLT